MPPVSPDSSRGDRDDLGSALRALPSVERLAAACEGPHHLAVAAARIEIAATRERIAAGTISGPSFDELREALRKRLDHLRSGNLRPVINATGVVLHTNLGRAPLAPEAAAQAAVIASSYSTLELDLGSGERGSRDDHLGELLRELSGAEAAIAVNNNAAAVMLAVAAVAADGEVVVGRDQLVEIGGSFRVPEIIAASGAELVEVGTTNRVRIADYAEAIGPRTRALMRVHQSNFRTVGFTETAGVSELGALAAERGLPLIDDLGSGAVEAIGDEPLVGESVRAGAELSCFSADKLLGGPQAGIIVGTAAAIERCRCHPLARALRLDKLQIAALEATLRLRRERPEAIPATAMLAPAGEALAGRARELVERIGAAAELGETVSRPGGGTLPTHELPGPACLVDAGAAGADRLLERLRTGEPAVVARIAEDRVLLDPRTISSEEIPAAAAAVRAALV